MFYGVVEFKAKGINKELAVVPLTWLLKNERKCYWPTCTNKVPLSTFIKNCTPPNRHWPHYSVSKIHLKTLSFEVAESEVDRLISDYDNINNQSSASRKSIPSESSMSSDDDISVTPKKKTPKKATPAKSASKKSTSKKITPIKQKPPIHQSQKVTKNLEDLLSEYTSFEKKATSAEPKRNLESESASLKAKTTVANESFDALLSGSTLNGEAIVTQLNPPEYVPMQNLSAHKGILEENLQILAEVGTVEEALNHDLIFDHTYNSGVKKNRSNLKSITDAASRITHAGSSITDAGNRITEASSSSGFQNTVLTSLAKIDTTNEQILLTMQEILRYNKKIALEKLIAPEHLPYFPLKTYEEFLHFENMVKDDDIVHQYMIRRLAALGGSGVEAVTRRILKYLITNDLGVNFNWKGRFNKIGFENTATMNIILEAAKLNFPINEKNDLQVAWAVKEWLKHSTTRIKMKNK